MRWGVVGKSNDPNLNEKLLDDFSKSYVITAEVDYEFVKSLTGKVI